MALDLSRLPLTAAALSSQPMTLCEPGLISALAPLIDMIALEGAPRERRAAWQARQLANLLGHAGLRSAFWRARIAGRSPAALPLSGLPVLTRAELRAQVETEGALFRPADRTPVRRHATSGSSGAPVSFFLTELNARFTQLRSLAQYLIEDRDLTLNKTQVLLALDAGPKGFEVKREPSWVGALTPYLQAGALRSFRYARPDPEALCRALEREPIGYLIAAPKALEMILRVRAPADLKRAGLAMYIPLGEATGPDMAQAFRAQDIPVRAFYSSEEVGVIGAECAGIPGAYHVCESSVIVETIEPQAEAAPADGPPLGRVLVTGLQSYATPFIRYDIGDLARLAPRCACGHDGPTLTDVRGRAKGFLTRADGAVLPFHLRAPQLLAVCGFDDHRIRQTAPATIIAEFARPAPLTETERAGLHDLIAGHAGPGFEVDIRWVEAIDWGPGAKRLGFRNELI